MRTLLLMLAVLMAITLWFRHDNLNLSRSFAKANQIAAEQKHDSRAEPSAGRIATDGQRK